METEEAAVPDDASALAYPLDSESDECTAQLLLSAPPDLYRLCHRSLCSYDYGVVIMAAHSLWRLGHEKSGLDTADQHAIFA